MKYTVAVNEVCSMEIEVEADSVEEAEDIAWEMLDNCEVDLTDLYHSYFEVEKVEINKEVE